MAAFFGLKTPSGGTSGAVCAWYRGTPRQRKPAGAL